MADETKESPTMEEGETKTQAKGNSEIDADGLIAELEKADIKTTEDLTNKLAVTQQYGQMANLLGEVRDENKELREMLKTSGRRNTETEDYSEASSELDLGAMVENKVSKALKKDREEQSKQQREAQQFALQRYKKVIGHKHYGRVKEVYEEKLRDPSMVIQLNTGQILHEDLFHDTLNEYWEGIARKSLETIKLLKGDGTETPLHMESGTEIPGAQKVETGESKKIKKLTEEVDQGKTLTEDDELDALMESLTK